MITAVRAAVRRTDSRDLTETNVQTVLLLYRRTAPVDSSPASPLRRSAAAMSPLGALLPLVLVAAWCSVGEADVGDFAPCLQVFYKSWPPKGLTGSPVCQQYHNEYRFATLYSRPRRSPWFSAYLYSAPAGKRPTPSWMFEPQVSGLKGGVD